MKQDIGYFLLSSIMALFAILIIPIVAGITIGILLAGCGDPITKGQDYYSDPKKSCTVSQTEAVVTISCPDETKAIIPLPANVPPVNSPMVTTVQLCPGTTSYPNSFPEQALCIDNQLFGVFFDGQNAWLSLLAPGNYRSTSTTNPCSFAVVTGCQISR